MDNCLTYILLMAIGLLIVTAFLHIRQRRLIKEKDRSIIRRIREQERLQKELDMALAEKSYKVENSPPLEGAGGGR
jgi:hypothetical protein